MTARAPLPSRRHSWTQSAVIGGSRVFVSCGEYEDGRLGEVFIAVSRTGSAMRATMDALAISISIGLQHGVPLGTYIHALRGIDFVPNGPVTGAEPVKQARSIIDFVAQHLATHYTADGRAARGEGDNG